MENTNRKVINMSDNKDKDVTISDLETNVMPESKSPEVKSDIKKDGAEKQTPEPITAKSKTPLQPWQKITLYIIVSIVILGATAVMMYYYIFTKPVSPSQVITIDDNYLAYGNRISSWQEKVKYLGALLPSPKEPRTEVSPINGLLFTKAEMTKLQKNRPVVAMINNHVKARPQSGLNHADIVYETVAESGITRYMALFWSQGPDKIGPIRSARQYHLEWLSPYDPLYIHDGCAASDDPRTNACGNIYSYGIKDLRTYGHWRVADRVAPHNEYNSVQNAWEYAAKNGWSNFPETDALKFKRDAEPQNRGARTHVKVRFRQDLSNGGLYDSEWIYDGRSNAYLHKIGGQADLDLETGKQVNAKVVVIEEVNLVDAYDGFARVIITTIGEGKATILQDGKVISGKWKKTSRDERERFYDSSGKELELNRGRLWITAVPKSTGKFDIIEQ